MCGINGVFNYSSTKDVEKKVKSMNDLTLNRGPDFSAIYIDDKVCLGHNRLSIIDLDAKSNQPFTSNDGKTILVYNGEIYNFLELKKEISKNYKFKTKSDTELIVAAYEFWGIDMLEKFNGMFSFALWDMKTEKFYLCRDRLGIKPLYYAEINQSIVFSSSIKAINHCLDNSLTIHEDDAVDFLTYGTVHSPNTIINEIKTLPRASYLLASHEETTIIEYWSFFNQTLRKKSNAKPHKTIQNLILDSVEKRMISDVPFGIFLSGGIDSSILVAAASKVSSQKVNTFSIVFKDEVFDERKYSRIIANQYKTLHNEIEIHADDLLNQIEEPFKFMDHPTIDGINTYFISKAVHQKGFKMAISGAGSDELFSGYPVFKNTLELNNKKWLYSFPPQIRKLASKLITNIRPNVQSNKIGEILNLRLLELPYYYPVFRKIFTDTDIIKIISEDLNLRPSYPFQWGIKELSFKERGSNLSFLNKVSSLEIETYLQNVLLRDADQMGMANSLEIRVPFLDHRLVEYVLSLSDKFKYPEYPKKLLVESVKGWIPKEIIHRKKMGFVFPWEKWMKNELQNFCFESIKHLESNHFLNFRKIELLWNNFLNGKSQVHWQQIWTLVVIGKWTAINLNRNR